MRNFLFLLLSVCFACLSFKKGADSTKQLERIAKEYKRYRRTSKQDTTSANNSQTKNTDSSDYNWAVAQCVSLQLSPHNQRIITTVIEASQTFISDVPKSRSPHGNKLYKLFVKNYDAYIQNAPAGQPLGQVLVKETWNVREVEYDSANKELVQVQSRNDGKWYTPTTVLELFVMYKEGENVTNDRGWNYGTYSLEAQNPNPQLLNNVKLSSCIGCHKETKYDRIFGPQ